MTDGFGTLPFGTGPAPAVPFRVLATVSLSKTLVRVDFTGRVDPDHAPNFNPGNYTIDGLTISNVSALGSHSLLLETSTHDNILYTLVVDATPGRLRLLDADFLDPLQATAEFEGVPATASFTATAQSRRKVRLTFRQVMEVDAAFSDPASYYLSRLEGGELTIDSVESTGPDATRGELTLTEDLIPFAFYVLRVSAVVHTASGESVFPDQAMVQWKEVIPRPIRIKISSFSGEVTTGLLGVPAGQVFFSPALGISVPNSVIQVEAISVCTRAYDVYTIPSLPDPLALFTWPAPLTGATSAIGASGGVLTASAHRLGQAQMVIQNRVTDIMPDAVDGPASGTLEETIDITRAAFLNDTRWLTYPGTGAAEGPFILADNLTSIGTGPTVNISLQP